MSRSALSESDPAAGVATFRMAPLMFDALAGTMAMMAFVAVVGPAVRQLGLPEWAAGLSITAGGVFWMVLARWWGGVSDRRGRRLVLLTGLGVFCATYLVLAVGLDLALHQRLGSAVAMALLVICRSMIGAVYAAVPPTTAALIADHTAPADRPARMARLGTANAIGKVAGPAAAGTLAAYDLSLALYAAAALPALAFLVIWRFVRPEGSPGTGVRPAVRLKLLDRRLRLASVTGLIAMAAVAVAQVLVGFFAIDRLHLDAQAGARAAGLALATVGLALIASQQFVMRFKAVLAIRWIAMGALIAAVGFCAVCLVRSQTQLLICYGTAAFGMGFIFPNFQALAANAVDRHEQGAAAGTVSAAQGLGMVLAPLAGTLLYRAWPIGPYLLVGALLLGLAVATGRLGWRKAVTGAAG